MGILSSKPDYSKIRLDKDKALRRKQTSLPADTGNSSGQGQKPAWRKWVAMGIVMALYLAFLLWVKSWWGLIVVPFIYDAYITKKINWGWWKDLENPVARTLMSWVDAIVFALIAVYFVHNFFFQNYRIPSSSLEKTLLTGDYLLVSKLSYGPRIPQTPLTMPLTQHTMPITGTKSYFDWPHWAYRRVSGLGTVQLGDIVVFNYPAGDTVATGYNYDFYDLCYGIGLQQYEQRGITLPPMSRLSTEEQMSQWQRLYQSGKAYVAANKNVFGSIVVRPTDRRENYVKRCVGLPGQTLEIRDKVIYLDGKPMPQPSQAQWNYYLYTTGRQILSDELCARLGISDEDRAHQYDRPEMMAEHRIGMPLTNDAKAALLAEPGLVDSIVEIMDGDFGTLYPLDHDYGWTRDNYGPVLIPAKGLSVPLTMDNIAIYERPIRAYEGNDLVVKDGHILINGEEATQYTFTLDYYWMMGDNRHNSADSRYWGFVPEDHIVGKPLFIWLSVSPDSNPAASTYRMGRVFSSASPRW